MYVQYTVDVGTHTGYYMITDVHVHVHGLNSIVSVVGLVQHSLPVLAAVSSSSDDLLVPVVRQHMGHRAFLVAGAAKWNDGTTYRSMSPQHHLCSR